MLGERKASCHVANAIIQPENLQNVQEMHFWQKAPMNLFVTLSFLTEDVTLEVKGFTRLTRQNVLSHDIVQTIVHSWIVKT